MRGQNRRGMSPMRWLAVFGIALAGLAAFALSATSQQSDSITIIPRLTGAASPMGEVPVPPLDRPITDDKRRMRNYPEQPPVIPHSIDGYQLTLNTNSCLSCHKREYTESSGAPMISVTHFMDRDGQVLSDVTPRRYFCTQCHVQQTDARPLVGNTFQDVTAVHRSQQ
jgi:nitrate reductase (cytochrome), electron transfer subunit